MKLERTILKLIIKKVEIDDLEEAISELQLLSVNSDFKPELISLKSRLQEIDKKQIQGTIDRENYLIVRNQIRSSLLNLIITHEKQSTLFYSKNIDEQFSKYASEVIEMYENRNIKKYFIPPKLIKGDKDITYFELLEDIQITNKRLTLILGNFGSGKSVLMENLFYQLLREFVIKKSKIPIFVKLKNYRTNEDIQDFINRTINERYGIDVNKESLIQAQRKGKFIFILDGFDEMLGEINTTSLQKGIQQIEHLLSDGISKHY